MPICAMANSVDPGKRRIESVVRPLAQFSRDSCGNADEQRILASYPRNPHFHVLHGF